MTPKEALNVILDYVNLDDYDYETRIRDAEILLKKSLTELEELKKRDTPMELTQASRFTTDKKLYGMYACNNCHEVIPYITLNNKRIKPNFCYHCGQRLDWEELK